MLFCVKCVKNAENGRSRSVQCIVGMGFRVYKTVSYWKLWKLWYM